jgi:hypothetical protein
MTPPQIHFNSSIGLQLTQNDCDIVISVKLNARYQCASLELNEHNSLFITLFEAFVLSNKYHFMDQGLFLLERKATSSPQPVTDNKTNGNSLYEVFITSLFHSRSELLL